MFDNHTIAFLLQPGLVAAFVAQLVNWRINRDVPGVRWWSVGMAMQTAGVMIRAQDNIFPPAIDIPFVNLLMVGGQFVLIHGMCRFAGRPMFVKTALAVLVALVAGAAYFTAVRDDVVTRTAIFAVAMAIAISLEFSLLPPIARREGIAAVVVLVIAYGMTLAAIVGRAIAMEIVGPSFFGSLHLGDSLAITGRQVIVSLVATVIATGYSYGYTLLVASRTRWELHQLATIDALTGAPNRRAFDTEFQTAVARVRRGGARLGLALMDLDHFKRVNDQHGHAVGDALLRHFGAVVRGVLRETDFFARIGGEEFVLMLTDDGIDSIDQAAERIRAAFEQSSLALPDGPLRATVSVGAVVSAAGEAEPVRLMAAADEALYRAKAGGRNRIERATMAPESAVAAAMPPALPVGNPMRGDSRDL